MRIVGFLLLFGGFAWLSWAAFSLGPITRVVMTAQYNRLPTAADAIFSREDVQRTIRDTLIDTFNRNPSFMLPGITMLAGGLLLAFTRRHTNSNPKES